MKKEMKNEKKEKESKRHERMEGTKEQIKEYGRMKRKR